MAYIALRLVLELPPFQLAGRGLALIVDMNKSGNEGIRPLLEKELLVGRIVYSSLEENVEYKVHNIECSKCLLAGCECIAPVISLICCKQ